jgi:hypothetical protein
MRRFIGPWGLVAGAVGPGQRLQGHCTKPLHTTIHRLASCHACRFHSVLLLDSVGPRSDHVLVHYRLHLRVVGLCDCLASSTGIGTVQSFTQTAR